MKTLINLGIGFFVLIISGIFIFKLHAKEDKAINVFAIKKQQTLLEEFIKIKKFTPEKFYPGAVNEASRQDLELKTNQLAQQLIELLPSNPTEKQLLDTLKKTADFFEQTDTEDRERFYGYLDQLVQILDIKLNNHELNKWLYGFDLFEKPENNNADAVKVMTIEEKNLLSKIDEMTSDDASQKLTLLLGPSTNSIQTKKDEFMQTWFLDKEATSGISLSTIQNKKTLIWVSNNRFLYTKNF